MFPSKSQAQLGTVDGEKNHQVFRVSVYSAPLARHSSDALLEVVVRKAAYPEDKIKNRLKKNNIVLNCGDKDRQFEVDTQGEPVSVHLTSVGYNWSVNQNESIQIIGLSDLLSSKTKYVVKTFCLRKDDSSPSDDLCATVVVRQGEGIHPRNLQLHAKIYMQPQSVCPYCHANLDGANQPGDMSRSISSDDSDVLLETGDKEDVTHPVQVSGAPIKVRPPEIDSGCCDDFGLTEMDTVEDHF